MRGLIRLILCGITWVAIALFMNGIVVDVFKVYFIPYMSLIVSVMSIMFPNIMDMGIDKYVKANLYEKLWPIGIVAVMLFVSKWFTPTVIVACVNSYYLGVTTTYISKIVTEKLEGGKR